MNYVKWLLTFLIINFSSLATGSWLMNNGPMTEWYINLNKAPWTPPSWVFGATWTLIMICFSIYLTHLFTNTPSNKIKIVFTLQVILNIMWNYIFFNQHLITLGLICISLLCSVLFYMFFSFKTHPKKIKLLLLPYMIWLLIATSLNGYILFYN